MGGRVEGDSFWTGFREGETKPWHTIHHREGVFAFAYCGERSTERSNFLLISASELQSAGIYCQACLEVAGRIVKTGSKPLIENWSIAYIDETMHLPPEMRRNHVLGKVYGSERPDGTLIKTSSIQVAMGKQVMTASGHVYLLGTPDPDFVRYVEETSGKPFDYNWPLKPRRKKV